MNNVLGEKTFYLWTVGTNRPPPDNPKKSRFDENKEQYEYIQESVIPIDSIVFGIDTIVIVHLA